MKQATLGVTDGDDGLDKYFDGDDSSLEDESQGSYEEIFSDEKGIKSVAGTSDPSKLIDFELIKLLQYCDTLKKSKEDDEDYQEDILLKSLDLGKKTAPKLLIFDMDETLIAAKFHGQVPKGFQETFNFKFLDSQIHVRIRPYVVDCLEKLAQFYEIIVFTAGTQEYADYILDYIDQDRKVFKKRLYR